MDRLIKIVLPKNIPIIFYSCCVVHPVPSSLYKIWILHVPPFPSPKLKCSLKIQKHHVFENDEIQSVPIKSFNKLLVYFTNILFIKNITSKTR